MSKAKPRWEGYKDKLDVTYTLMGIGVDVLQLARSNIRRDKKGMRANVAQIIKRLESVKGRL